MLRRRVFGVFGQGEVYQQTLGTLKSDADPRRRAYAAEALGEFLAAPGVVACAEAVRNDADPGVRAAAAGALGRLNDDGGGALSVALGDGDARVKLSALRAVSRVNAFGDVSALVRLSGDGDALVRRRAVQVLDTMRSKDSAATLLALAKNDPDAEVPLRLPRAGDASRVRRAPPWRTSRPTIRTRWCAIRRASRSFARPRDGARRPAPRSTLHAVTKRTLAGSLTSAGLSFGLLLALLPAACSKEEPRESTYFDRAIAPVLSTSCSRANTGAGCHVSTPKGNAFGNLDTTSFEGIDKRRDLLADYGPYGQPAFLVKNVPDFQVEVKSFDGTRVVVTTDIKHAGGPIFEPTATAYQTLRRWINAGATKNNTGIGLATAARTACSTAIPSAPGFDPGVDPSRADFGTFRDRANPVFRSCAAGNCHGTPANDLYLTCGDSPEQIRWNYFAATQYLGQTPEESEITRRPARAVAGRRTTRAASSSRPRPGSAVRGAARLGASTARRTSASSSRTFDFSRTCSRSS